MRYALLLLVAAGCLSKPGFTPGGGDDDDGPPAAAYDPKLAVGADHACAITNAGTLWCWGANDQAQIDTTDGDTILVPTQIGAESSWSAVAAGQSNTCGIAGGTVRCWGSNHVSESGGSDANQGPVASLDLGGFAPVRLFAHEDGACAIDAAGKMMCWGEPAFGGGMTPMPLDPGGGGNAFTQVALSSNHACAITTGGSVLCWGSNGSGQLGVPGTADVLPVNATARDGTYIAVAVASNTTCAVTSTHALQCWGAPVGSLYADMAPATDRDPDGTIIDATHAWDTLTMDINSACAIAGGEVYCYGYSDTGQAGDGFDYHPIDKPAILQSTSSVQAGDGFVCARATTGAIECWGQNRYGNLGTGEIAHSIMPQLVAAESTTQPFLALKAGDRHACTLANGKVSCWGDNRDGQIDFSMNSSAIYATPHDVPLPGGYTAEQISTGRDHTCAIASDSGANTHVAFCWGSNAFGQLGVDGDSKRFAQLSGNWRAISAGTYATCAIATSNGNLYCWGHVPGSADGTSQTVPAAPTITSATGGFEQISIGDEHAVVTDGTDVFGFGDGCAATGDSAAPARIVPASATKVIGLPVVPSAGGLIDIFAAGGTGGGDSCAVIGKPTDPGLAFCWGSDADAELGPKTCTIPMKRTPQLLGNPVPIEPPGNGTSIAMSVYHGCIKSTDSDLWCWGDDTDEELGTRVATDPATIYGTFIGHPWSYFATGPTYSCGVSSEQDTSLRGLYCWGTSVHGELGNGWQYEDKPTPTLFIP